MLILIGCTAQDSAYIKDGKAYGVTSGLFRHQWWNYYERGISFAEGGFYDEAIQDLKEAIRQRSKDNWRSRTYGMHFLNYFPSRELGIIYYRTKRFNEARQELERSLQSAESAKARYFLNKTRASLLQQTGTDSLPPFITIDSPQDGTVTNAPSITLKGHAEDDHYISSLHVNDVPLSIELSAKIITLDRNLMLNRGANMLTVRASDLTGKTTEKSVTIHVDRDGPMIIIENHEVKNRKVTLTGFVTDSTNINSLHINGRPVSLNSGSGEPGISGREIRFKQEIYLPDSSDTLVIRAADTAGNATEGKLNTVKPSTLQAHLTLLASSQPASAETYAVRASALGNIFDNIPPIIQLDDYSSIQTVYTESLYFEGRVSDAHKVRSILINGEPVLRRKGKTVFFNYLSLLEPGANTFSIQATDMFGNTSHKNITVTRMIPKIRQLSSRMSVSILPLERKGMQSIAGDMLFDGLTSAFVQQKRFHLIERERLEEILSELRLSQTTLVEPGTASEIGRIAAADTILIGTIYESRNAMEVFTRLVDTESSHIIDMQNVYTENKSLHGMKQLMQGLAVKYSQSFPLLEGTIISKDETSILTTLGGADGVKQNMRLLIFREGHEIVHPVSEKVLGSEPVTLGDAKVEKVYHRVSRAIIKHGDPAKISSIDKVITK